MPFHPPTDIPGMGLSLLLIFSPVCTQSALNSLFFSLVLIGAVLNHVSDHSVDLFAATLLLATHTEPSKGSPIPPQCGHTIGPT
jgi:hypothetical protein